MFWRSKKIKELEEHIIELDKAQAMYKKMQDDVDINYIRIRRLECKHPIVSRIFREEDVTQTNFYDNHYLEKCSDCGATINGFKWKDDFIKRQVKVAKKQLKKHKKDKL